jgi:2-amino-4-hydroxy-6-hydroxymethyldihydropteridine diphosphokinase
MCSKRIAFGLGSNLGERELRLAAARCALAQIEGIIESSLHASSMVETSALLPEGAPELWNMPYLNQVVMGRITEAAAQHPEALLAAVKTIETHLGRQHRGHWSPREVDIDIIAIEGITHHSATLTIPHPHAHRRAFVLQPLLELWPDCVLANGISARAAFDALYACMHAND